MTGQTFIGRTLCLGFALACVTPQPGTAADGALPEAVRQGPSVAEQRAARQRLYASLAADLPSELAPAIRIALSSDERAQLQQVVPSGPGPLEAFFFYRTSACDESCPSNTDFPKTLGATIKATNSTGDFTLLALKQMPPSGTVMLGWNTTPVAFTEAMWARLRGDGAARQWARRGAAQSRRPRAARGTPARCARRRRSAAAC